jgi:hypothetical protein
VCGRASAPVLFGRRRVRLSSFVPSKQDEGGGAPNGATTAAPSCERHGASPCDRGRCAFRRSTRGVLPKLPGTALPCPDRRIVAHHPGASAPFVRSLVQPDYRLTLVVGSGDCPGSPGRPGANRTARAPHQPESVTPPTTRRSGSSPLHLPIRSATDRRRRRPSASRVTHLCISS